MNEYLLWVDVETSGLDPQKDALLEIAMALTTCDAELKIIDPNAEVAPRRWVFHHGDFLPLGRIHPHVLAMHSVNGLWAESRNARQPKEVWAGISGWVRQLALDEGDSVYLAGRSVHFDRAWLEHHMPEETQRLLYLSHRHFDLSSIKMFLGMAGYEFGVPDEPHRARQDVASDIGLARELLSLTEPRYWTQPPKLQSLGFIGDIALAEGDLVRVRKDDLETTMRVVDMEGRQFWLERAE